jgi:cell division protein FtsW
MRTERRHPNLRERSVNTEPEFSRRHRPDHMILVFTALLLVIGLIVVYSISPGLAASAHVSQSYFIGKQLIDVFLGVIAFSVFSLVPLKQIFQLAKPLLITAAIGCIIVMIMPVDAAYPAHRWIRLGSFSFQIVELLKLAMLLNLAIFLTDRWRRGLIDDWKGTIRPLVIGLLVIGAVVAKLQSDFGSAVVIMSMMAMMAYVAGIPLKRIGMIGAVLITLFVLAISTTPYRRERLATFLHPDSNCQGSSYQACQTRIAVGSGGLLGLGLGHSVQAYGYTPEASNDSVFAIMAEEFGFIGTTMIIVLFGLYIARLKKVIERSANQTYRLVTVGVLAWFSTQLIINVGAMVGLLPLKGITLPLISQGGTSLVFLTAALGLVYQISRYTSYNAVEPKNVQTNNQTPAANSLGGRRLGRAYNSSVIARPRS